MTPLQREIFESSPLDELLLDDLRGARDRASAAARGLRWRRARSRRSRRSCRAGGGPGAVGLRRGDLSWMPAQIQVRAGPRRSPATRRSTSASGSWCTRCWNAFTPRRARRTGGRGRSGSCSGCWTWRGGAREWARGRGSAELLGKARAALTRYHERLREEPAQPLWFERPFAFDLGPHHVRGGSIASTACRRGVRVDRLQDRLRQNRRGSCATTSSSRCMRSRRARRGTSASTRQAYYYVLDDRKVPVPRGCGQRRVGARGGDARRGGDPRAGLRADPLARGVRAVRLPHRVPGGGAVGAIRQRSGRRRGR